MLYYNQNNNAASYLCDLIPQKKNQSTTIYPLRNGSDIINIMYNFPYIRSITYDSFIPKAISQWKSLNPSLQNADLSQYLKLNYENRNTLANCASS